MQILEILFSSVVIVAIMDYLSKSKSNNIQFVTSARGEWRKDIKTTANEIGKASKDNIREVLVNLKVNLNGYGLQPLYEQYPAEKHLDFNKDEHIWKEISYIEKNLESMNDESFISEKNKLIEYLTALLKFDWERTKQEVKTHIFFPFCTVFYFLIEFVLIYFFSEEKEIINKVEANLSVIVNIIFAYCIMWIPYLLEKPKILQEGKWYKNFNRPAFYLICSYLFIIFGVYAFYNEHKPTLTKEGRDLILLVSLILLGCILFATIVPKRMYLDYDNAIMKIMGADTITFYRSGKAIQIILLNNYFEKRNVNFKEKNLLPELDRLMNKILDHDNGVMTNPKNVLRFRSRLLYCVKNKLGLYTGTINTFIRKKPKRAKLIVTYTSDKVDEIFVGYFSKDTKLKKSSWIS